MEDNNRDSNEDINREFEDVFRSHIFRGQRLFTPQADDILVKFLLLLIGPMVFLVLVSLLIAAIIVTGIFLFVALLIVRAIREVTHGINDNI